MSAEDHRYAHADAAAECLEEARGLVGYGSFKESYNLGASVAHGVLACLHELQAIRKHLDDQADVKKIIAASYEQQRPMDAPSVAERLDAPEPDTGHPHWCPADNHEADEDHYQHCQRVSERYSVWLTKGTDASDPTMIEVSGANAAVVRAKLGTDALAMERLFRQLGYTEIADAIKNAFRRGLGALWGQS